ncbi:MAG: T9SS type A sorting domain-containing protein [Bacteroidales bacterium]|nr:T9SS type A sorting domain-containing protein [Bacteroidales bacterium]
MKLKKLLILIVIVSLNCISLFATETLTPVHIQSDNASSSLAKVGDNIALTFTSSGAISSVVVTISGHNITGGNLTNVGNNWTATYTMVGGDSEGAIAFTIDYTEMVAQVTSTTDGSSVTFDKTSPAAPTISGISAGYFSTNQTFTVSGEAGATIEYSTNNGGLWTSYSGAVTLSAEGTYNVLARQTDQAGNGPTASAVITLTIDKTAPTAPTISGISAGSYNTDQIFTVSGEASATIEYSTNNGGLWTAYSGAVTISAEGTYNVLARQTDQAGNGPTASTAITLTIDKTAPAAPTISGISAGSYNTDQIFTVSGEASATIEYSTNNGGLWTSYSGAVTLSAEGTYNVLARQTDQAGNGPIASAIITLTIDKTAPAAPTISGISAGSYNTDQIFTVSGEASATIEYSTNNGGLWTAYSGAVTISAEGTYNVLARQTDQAGNGPTASTAITLTIDKTAPAAPTISGISAGSYNTDQIFTVSGEASATIEYSTNNGGLWTAYSGAVTISAEGTYNVLARQTDQAGNGPTASAIITLTIDKTAPNAPSVTGTTPTNDQTPTWSWSAGGGGGNGTFRYKLDDSDLTSGATTTTSLSYTPGTNLTEASHTLYVQERDAAGNWSTSGSFVIVIDITTQTPTLTLPASNSFINKDVEIKFTLPEVAKSGTVKMTFIRPSATDRSVTFTSDFETSGEHTTMLNGEDLVNNIHVASGNGNNYLYDTGVYSIKIEYQDLLGNPVSFVTNTNIQYGSTKPTPSFQAISSPRNTRVGIVNLDFDKYVKAAQVTWDDFTLTRNGTTNVPLDNSLPFTFTHDYDYGGWYSNSFTLDLTVYNTLTDGSYELKLKATGTGIKDFYGNDLMSGANVIWTMDATPPTLTTVHIQSNNANPAFAKPGNEITVSFTSSETIQTPTATINGNVASISFVSGNSWTAKYIMVNGDTEGDITFNISFQDLAGNNANVTSVTDGSYVTFLKSAPTLSTTTIKSNNTNIALAKSGDIITLDFTSAKALANVVVTIAGHTVIATGSDGDKTWTASYIMTGTDAEGTIPFTINFTDKPGNAGVQVSNASTSVIFDRTLPTLSSVSISSNYVNTNKVGVGGIVTLTITGSENLVINAGDIKFEGNNATIAGSNNSWTATYTMLSSNTAGIVPFTINFTDLAGNIGTQVISSTNGSSVTFDQTSPVLSSVSILSNNIVTTQAKVGNLISMSFTASEAIEGVAIKLNGKNISVTNPSGNNWTANYTMLSGDAEGALYITIDCKDFSGNTAQITNTSITFDKTAPILTEVKISSNNITPAFAKEGEIVTLTFKTNEDIKTPVVGTNLGNASVTGGPRDWTATRTVAALDAQGLITFSIPIIDLSDNSGTTGTSTTNGSSVTVDCLSPTISATVPFGIYKVGSTIPVTITSDDKTYTGQTISVNSKVQTLINNNNNTYTINYQVQEGDDQLSSVATLPVNLLLKDYAGNTNVALTSATVVGGTLTLNSSTPQISSFTSDATGAGILKIGDQIVFTLTTAIAETGLAVTPSTYNSKPLTWTTTNGGGTYTATYTVQEGDADQVTPLQLSSITIADGAGNTSNPYSYTSIGKSIYATRPTYTISGTSSRCVGAANLDVTFTFTGKQPFTFTYNDKDDGSGTSTTINNLYANSKVISVASGSYIITNLVDGSTNSATTNSSVKAIITENALPSITFINSLNPGLTINKLASAYRLIDFVTSPTGGTFTGDCVGSTGGFAYFYPSLAGVTTTPVVKTITYSYTNSSTGCSSTNTFNIQVTGTKAFLTGLSSNKSYCVSATEATHVITATGMGAITAESFSVTGATKGVEWDDYATTPHSIIIDPKLFSTGNHDITYTYTEDGTTLSTTETITIVRVSTTIDFGPLSDKYCKNSEPITLVGDLPVGTGHFSCSSTGFSTVANSNSATFSPSSAPLSSTITISYYYETPEGCQSTPKEHTTIVNPVPTPDFTIKDNYNFDETPIFLNPPANGSYSGEIISSNTIFPLYASKIGFDIPITYTLTENGCSGSITHNTKVYKANAGIKVGSANMADSYCYSNEAFDISCDPAIGYDFAFTSTKNALTQTSDHIANYSINKAGAGTDIIKYKYYIGTGINKTPYEIVKSVFIDSIGIVSFDLSSNYCKNNAPVQVLGTHRVMNGENTYSIIRNRVNSVNPNSFIFNPLYATFTPSIADTGSFEITYTFTSDKGCIQSITKQTSVNSVPKVEFSLAASCPGINKDITFKNETEDIPGSTITWDWNFEPDNGSTLKDPTYKYTFAGLKPVKLVATTEKDCKDELTNYFTVGVSAKADFNWINDCLTGDSVKFTNVSSGGEISTATWKYNNTQISTNVDSLKYLFSGLGKYNMTLAISTKDGCIDSVKKQVVIQPYIKFLDLPQHIYSDNFESGTQNWNAKSILDGGNSSWVFGIPTGTVFKADVSSNAWYTNIGFSTQKVENSQVISPCFDMRGLTKPMIKMNIWSAPEAGRDGAVLQYSTDGGTTWKTNNKDNNVGQANEGINWFDPGNISSKPAGQSTGWSSTDTQTGWKSARHNLDTLKGLSNVRFRIVYANEANNIKPFNGFAFDDVWIGDRQQLVLDEYFTNSTVSADTSINNYIKQIEKFKKEDIIPIHYHTGNPIGDVLFNYYSAGPSSRLFYYGVSQVPYIFTNGITSSELVDASSKLKYEKSIDVETLKDPMISIGLNVTSSNVSLELKALKDLTGDNLVLYCAIVKDSILDGNVYYYNVLRKFIPNPGGILISTSDWVSGQTISQSIPVNIDNSSSEFINARVVVFVQNSTTLQVYQAASFKLSALTGDHPIDISNLVDIYPNPVNDYLIIESETSIDRLMIFDIAGRVVGNYTPAQTRYSVPVQNMESGIYIIKGNIKKGQFIRKFVKQ